MNIQVNAYRLRFAADMQILATTKFRTPNFFNAEMPRLPKGTAAQFELGLFVAGNLLDLSNIASLTLQVFASQSDATVLMEKTLASGEFNDTINQVDFDDGTDQHAVFAFTSQETNIAPGTYWLVVSGITNAGESLDYLITDFVIYQDQAGEPTSPPAQPPDVALTLSQALGLFVGKKTDQAREQLGTDGYWYEFTESDGLYHQRWADLEDGEVVRKWNPTGVATVP